MSSLLETPRGSVTIRPIREGDVITYRDLRLEALLNHPEAFGADYEENLAQPESHWVERVRKNVGDGTSIVFVAEASQTLLGMTGIFQDVSAKTRHNATIWGVYVRPGWRGLGVADALVSACIDWARKKGVNMAKLAVVTTNAAAIRCYLRCGFSVYGVDPKPIYFGSIYYDELLMVRHL
jgi:RimJ/RimL family protein N-acetyltransferase